MTALRVRHAVLGSNGVLSALASNILCCKAHRSVRFGKLPDAQALRVLLSLVSVPAYVRAWRHPVGRLFALPTFFNGLTRRTVPLWSRVINIWLCLETPKVAVGMLVSGKFGRSFAWFASTASEADAHADALRRISFALWAGQYNQYVGALQGSLVERLLAGFKFGAGSEKTEGVRWVVQVMLCLKSREVSTTL